MPFYTPQDKKDFRTRDARDMFVRICITFIAKSGSEKDPQIEKILPFAKQIVDKAFEFYPSEESGGEAGDPELPTIET